MKPPGPEAPVVLVKWYDYAKWLLERVENFPKSQRFVLGQRLAGQAMDVLDLLVEASTPYLPHDSPSEHLTQKANS